MGENMFKTTGTFVPDQLIVDNSIPITVKGIKVAKGEGVLRRGTLLGIANDGMYRRTDTAGSPSGEEEIAETASMVVGVDCILADDVDATLDTVVTTAYITGTFNRAAVILPEGKEVSAYETELRKLGIFLRTVQEY